MSPQMKRFVPHMAAQYGFEYEFVTYRWPSWLHRQVPLLDLGLGFHIGLMTLPVTHVLLAMYVEWCALGQVKRAKQHDTMLDVQVMPCAVASGLAGAAFACMWHNTIASFSLRDMMMCFT